MHFYHKLHYIRLIDSLFSCASSVLRAKRCFHAIVTQIDIYRNVGKKREEKTYKIKTRNGQTCRRIESRIDLPINTWMKERRERKKYHQKQIAAQRTTERKSIKQEQEDKL